MGTRNEQFGVVPIGRRALLRAVGLGALAGPVLAACGGGRPSAGGPGSATLPAPSLQLLGNAPLHVAAAQGYFTEAGIGVELADVIGTDVIRTIQTTSPVGIAGAIPTAVAYSKGVTDLRIVAPMFGAAQNTFIAPAGGPVTTLADLRPGMKIGGSIPSTPPTYFAQALIREAGLAPGDVEIVNLGRAPDAWTAAQQGLVAMTWSNPPLDTQLIASNAAVRIVSAAELLPKWLDTAVVTTQAHLDRDRDAVTAVAGAVAKARALLLADPGTAAQAWARGAGLDPAVTTAALAAAPAGAWTVGVDREALRTSIGAAREMGSLTGDEPDLDTLVSELRP